MEEELFSYCVWMTGSRARYMYMHEAERALHPSGLSLHIQQFLLSAMAET